MLTHRQKKIYPNNTRCLISSPKPWEVWNDKILKSSKEIAAKKSLHLAQLSRFLSALPGQQLCHLSGKKLATLTVHFKKKNYIATHPHMLEPGILHSEFCPGRAPRRLLVCEMHPELADTRPCSPHDLQALTFQEAYNFGSQPNPGLVHLLLTCFHVAEPIQAPGQVLFVQGHERDSCW